jgi:hypothetical protein
MQIEEILLNSFKRNIAHFLNAFLILIPINNSKHKIFFNPSLKIIAVLN